MRDRIIAFLLVFFLSNPRRLAVFARVRRGIGRDASLFMLVLA